MRDISRKQASARTARAQARLRLDREIIKKIESGDIPKGDPLPIAKMAAVQAAKQTWQLIPYCHQIPVEYVGVEFTFEENSILIQTEVKSTYKTGVEMEALAAASVAALTIYDMVKMLDAVASIENIELLSKTGGKSDYRKGKQNNSKHAHELAGPADSEKEPKISACILVLSDSISAGKSEDKSGDYIRERLEENGIRVVEKIIIPDEPALLENEVKRFTDVLGVDLVITSGGTGISPRDKTPETLELLFDKSLPGVTESIRAFGQTRTPLAMLSRANAGIRSKSVIISLPGSTGAARDALDVVLPHIKHAVDMFNGLKHDQSN